LSPELGGYVLAYDCLAVKERLSFCFILQVIVLREVCYVLRMRQLGVIHVVGVVELVVVKLVVLESVLVSAVS